MSPPIRPIAGSQMAVFLINSRLGLLSAAPHLLQQEPHFFRSYVCILPSSLTRVRSCASDFSSHLRVSVCGTVPCSLALGSISRHHDYVRFASTFSQLAFSSPRGVGLPAPLFGSLIGQGRPSPCRISPHASCRRNCTEYRTLDRFPIGYAFPPRLRGRLTRGRLPLPRKP